MKQENTKLQEIIDITNNQSTSNNKLSNSTKKAIKLGGWGTFYRFWIVLILTYCIGMSIFLSDFILEGNSAQKFALFTILYGILGTFAYNTLNKYLLIIFFAIPMFAILGQISIGSIFFSN